MNATSDVHNVAYCIVLNNGKWIGPRTQSGGMDRSIVDDIVRQAAGSTRPTYVRVTEASATVGSEIPATDSDEYRAMREFVDAGIKLGVAINVLETTEPSQGCTTSGGGKQKSGRCVRTAADIVAQAKQIKANGGDFYDWIFLDFAWTRTPTGSYGLDDLQQVVDGVRAAGWPRLMINASGFGVHGFAHMPQNAWGIARHFELLADSGWRNDVGRALQSPGAALTAVDTAFVDYVEKNLPTSAPVLKLEVHNEVDEFQQLSSADQNALLQQWASAGQEHGYKMIYPLCVGADQPTGGTYDSRAAGTFWPQRQLMYRYDSPAR